MIAMLAALMTQAAIPLSLAQLALLAWAAQGVVAAGGSRSGGAEGRR
jgi:hypothetical protein